MIANLLLLTGEDSYRLGARSRLYREKFVEKYPDGEVTFFTGENTFLELENTILTPNLFGGKRMAVCEGFWDAEKFETAQKADFFKRLPDFADQSTLMVLLPKVDKRLKFSKFLLSEAKTETFDLLDENQALEWVTKHAQKIGGKIDYNAARFLIQRCGINLWNLSQEIQKLSFAGDGEITKDLIEKLTLPHPQMEIWDFTEKLSRQDAPGAIAKFRTLLQMGQTPHQIFPMIQREIRIHAQLRAGLDQNLSAKEIATAAKLHPFVVSKTLSLTKNFSAEKIKDMYEMLFVIDKKLKTGAIYGTTNDMNEFELEIEKFILQICR